MTKVHYLPQGYRNVTPYLMVNNASKAIDYYKKTFGAIETMRFTDSSSGKVGHAEIKIGDSVIMLADEFPGMNKSPKTLKGSPVGMMLYVLDVDVVVKNAVAAGAKITKPVADQFYGDRSGGIEDPFGHHWHVSTHIKDVSPEELKKAEAEMKKEKK